MSERKLNDISITAPSLLEVFNLPQMFYKAVTEEYKIYDKQTQDRILHRHSLSHLLVARFKTGRMLLVAKEHGKIAGVLIGSYSADGVGTVAWIYVLPKYRKQHAAKTMLEHAKNQFILYNCHKMVVTTEVARNFYLKLGFSEEAVMKNHWWGKDFYFFSKFLDKE